MTTSRRCWPASRTRLWSACPASSSVSRAIGRAPEGLAIDAYTQVANVLDLDPALPPRVKSIVQPAAVSAVDIHLAFPADEPLPGTPTETAEESVRGVAQLNHYYTRSFDEFETKRFRGSATGRIARPAVPFDLATIRTDTAASRFSGRTQASLARLRSLDPQPYAYGSQLALEYFPRPNDLFRFGEFAIANTAAGLPQPSRVAAMRLRNLADGVGLIVDLADTGYVPERDGLSDSVHTQALLEHMRGHLATTLSRSDELPMMAAAGSLVIPDSGPALLHLPDGLAEVLLQLPPEEARRCYALGFVVGASAAVRVRGGRVRQGRDRGVAYRTGAARLDCPRRHRGGGTAAGARQAAAPGLRGRR